LITADPLIGRTIGTFLIQHLLGRGGMARVYKGLDTTLKRPVAVKVIEEGYRTSDTYTLRFEREAQAVANLKHPNIITIFHFGRHEGLYYLVMEYVDGADLDTVSRNYTDNGELMPHNDVIRILDAIAAALDYAHSQGVIHRDVKPSNIMIERNGRPVLTDFGLALRVSEGTVGESFGSPHYISPEQARNSANAVPQSDLYSLGIVAYELLTGAVPFDDPSPTALAVQHLIAPVPSARSFNRSLSEDVERVLNKILAKNPEERYQTGQEFIAALGAALEKLKQQPVKLTTAEVPLLPPGVEPPPPRRLSMQSALDKVSQHMLLEQAKGQSLTQHTVLSSNIPAIPQAQPPKRGMPVLLVSGLGVLIIAVLAILLFVFASSSQNNTTSTTTESSAVAVVSSSTVQPTSTDTSTATSTATMTVTNDSGALLATADTSTLAPSSTIPPTNTPSPAPTDTTAPTAIPTSVPPTTAPTLIPATDVPPTDAPIPTDAANAAPTLEAEPTVLYPDGLQVSLIYDTRTFYFANKSDQRILMQNLAFERLFADGQAGDRYEGIRWGAFYPWSEPRRCIVLHLPRASWRLPSGDCPNGYNSEIATQDGESFWMAADNSTEFRVLWSNNEVARCPVATSTEAIRCEIRYPRN
jgi:serine/threonine protein kinase